MIHNLGDEVPIAFVCEVLLSVDFPSPSRTLDRDWHSIWGCHFSPGCPQPNILSLGNLGGTELIYTYTV